MNNCNEKHSIVKHAVNDNHNDCKNVVMPEIWWKRKERPNDPNGKRKKVSVEQDQHEWVGKQIDRKKW